ncbi:hypothetical protein ID866_5008 [Astraeus odoratus]|nr:hypothetical protein ID866_5008 [Astraeus odoratus]
MGGKAFSQELPSGSFPRLPQHLYQDLKGRLTPLLATVFSLVGVPPEAPGKKDHGDIDFVVAQPIPTGEDVTPELVARVLGAVKSVELDGNRTSHYALELSQEDAMRIPPGSQILPSSQKLYLQVDVRVCLDAEEFERLMVLHGYGDLGIMIGAIARSHGLVLSTKGLKVPSPPPDAPLYLSGSIHAVLDFMDLSVDRWKEGFDRVEQIFAFASTSRLFDPHRLRIPQMHTFTKSVSERTMYHDFLVWTQGQQPAVYCLGAECDAIADALLHFGKKDEWDAAALVRNTRLWLKNNFNGKLVAEWTGLKWRGVKTVMDDVRASAGGEAALVGRPLEDIKNLVLASKTSLKLEEISTEQLH